VGQRSWAHPLPWLYMPVSELKDPTPPYPKKVRRTNDRSVKVKVLRVLDE
jgi:hypothetical protein